MNSDPEERAIADRLSSYSDAVTAFALVNAFAFLIGAAEADVRCSLADNRGFVMFAIGAVQLGYLASVLALRTAEERLRHRAKLESSVLATRFRHGFFVARVVFISLVTLLLLGFTWVALAGSGCSGPGFASSALSGAAAVVTP